MATGMSSGVELPPRCRAWVTTAGRPTRRCGRVRPQKTTARWRGPVTPEPNPFGGAEPKQGYRIGRRSQTLTDSVTVPGPGAFFRGRAARWLVAAGAAWVGTLTAAGPGRSEEHTSELQSRPHLVCRLLLEKKKKTAMSDTNGVAKGKHKI